MQIVAKSQRVFLYIVQHMRLSQCERKCVKCFKTSGKFVAATHYVTLKQINTENDRDGRCATCKVQARGNDNNHNNNDNNNNNNNTQYYILDIYIYKYLFLVFVLQQRTCARTSTSTGCTCRTTTSACRSTPQRCWHAGGTTAAIDVPANGCNRWRCGCWLSHWPHCRSRSDIDVQRLWR